MLDYSHEYYQCPSDCNRMHCLFCEGGLLYCVKCCCGEGTLPTDCPNEWVNEEKQHMIYKGQLNFTKKNGWSE